MSDEGDESAYAYFLPRGINDDDADEERLPLDDEFQSHSALHLPHAHQFEHDGVHAHEHEHVLGSSVAHAALDAVEPAAFALATSSLQAHPTCLRS